jgi:hypothetical protein
MGRVTEVFHEEGVEVQAVGSFIQGIFGIGGETYGKIKMIAKSPDEVIDESKIPADCKHEILVGGSFASFEAVKKAIAGGAAALVVGGFDSFDLKKLLGYEQGVCHHRRRTNRRNVGAYRRLRQDRHGRAYV